MHSIFALVRANQALSHARSELARLAADNERNLIARDLHDLLGHSLTTITVKAGRARRLSATDPARSAAEIAEVEEWSRQSIADGRAAVTGYRDVTLACDWRRAGSCCAPPTSPPTCRRRPMWSIRSTSRCSAGWCARERPTWCATRRRPCAPSPSAVYRLDIVDGA